jgi:beta-glucanase (GH16 family)
VRLEKLAYLFGLVFVVAAFLGFAITQDRSVPTHANAAQASKQTQGVNSNSVISGRQLVFSDEFNGSTLDNGSWATCYDWRLPTESGCTNAGNSEQEWYTDNQVQVQNGNLVISATKSTTDVSVQHQAKTFNYQSGMINSGRGSTNSSVRWAGTYGYYETRMKFQKGQGIWPAFWLLPVDKEWPPEIDAMEFIGSKPSQILQTVHWQAAGTPQKSVAVISDEPDYSTGWHTYGVDWEPDHIDWYVDGKKTRSYTGPNIPNTPMEVIVNLAVGGLLPGNADKTTLFPSELWVDYVRVYQTPGQTRPHQY